MAKTIRANGELTPKQLRELRQQTRRNDKRK